MKANFTLLQTLTVFIVLAASAVAHAQTNTWILVSGVDSSFSAEYYYVPIVYGAEGVPSDTASPGTRAEAITWVDANNDLWLFGGNPPSNYGADYAGDLWKYTIGANEWTWASGDSANNPVGRYGTQGVASALNRPSGRAESAGWADSAGNLWLFGGDQYTGFVNDVWKYNISSGLWTWVNGDSATYTLPTHGTQGVANAANTPGARHSSTAWMGKNGLLWLFGGIGNDDNSDFGTFNDLWNYNTATNQWTWVSGDSVVSSPGSYGVIAHASTTNSPPARYGAAGNWVDASGNLWLFGGDNNAGGVLNDLWKYDATANEWTWVNGGNSVNLNGTYGTMGTYAAANTPGARTGSAYWTEANGDFWLFGGGGFDSSNTVIGLLNDLWKYNVAINQWVWMGGSGKIDAAHVKGYPNGSYDLQSWTDNSGVFWLYGGSGYNDLWKYTPDTVAYVTAITGATATLDLAPYPNPSSGQFTINMQQGGQVTIYNSLGQLVVTQNLPVGQQQLNIGKQPAGIYSLIVANGQTQQAVKLVVE